jgi:uncharacterized protein
MTTTVNCPTCKNEVVWEPSSTFRPFCSKRCQLIDLGDWSEENNKISSPVQSAANFDPKAAQDMIEDIEAMLAKNDDFFK